MALLSTDQATPIPDADLLDQDLPATGDPLSALSELQRVEATHADEADLLEQLTALPVDDEEAYPNAWARNGFDA